MRTGAAALALLVAGLAGSACFSEHPDYVTGPGGEADAEVVMTNGLRFVPATVTIERGQTVAWTSPGGVVHTVTDDPAVARESGSATLPAGADPWDSGSVPPGGTFRLRFDVAGTYRYFCAPHELQGMKGTVVVRE